MLRIVMIVVSIAAMGLWAEEPAARKKAPAKKAAAKSEVAKVPKGAKLVAPGMWKWTDPKGKVWVYNETPFGIMKGEEPKDVQPEPIPTDWKITDGGETLTFERPWPFGGVNRWTKNKNDLTEMEQAVWDQHRKAHAAKSEHR